MLAVFLVSAAAVGVPAPAVPQNDAHVLSATVRLSVYDERGVSVGSGTVVERSDSGLLVVTCAHIFDVNRMTSLQVTVFSGHDETNYPAELLLFDQATDVALVHVSDTSDIQPVSIAHPDHLPCLGEHVVVAGCDLGGLPSARKSQIVEINRFIGPENIQVAAIPVNGRSGGGLFNSRNELIGVCNGAEPTQKQGIYAGLSCIYKVLAGWNDAPPKQHERPETTAGFACTRTAAQPQQKSQPLLSQCVGDGRRLVRAKGTATSARCQQPEMRPDAPNCLEVREIVEVGRATEVVCIVRTNSDAGSNTRIVVIDNPSPEFVRTLDREQKKTAHRQK